MGEPYNIVGSLYLDSFLSFGVKEAEITNDLLYTATYSEFFKAAYSMTYYNISGNATLITPPGE